MDRGEAYNKMGQIMQNTPNLSFHDCVNLQVEMLQAGQPLEAFDRFFAADGIMYANDEVFARGAEEARRKQESFILSAKSINGLIVGLCISDDHEICVFQNRTSFTASDDGVHQIDGLCWQRWRGAQIAEERYYDGDQMQQLLSKGILLNPEVLSI